MDGIEVLGKTLDSLFPPMCANEADYAFLLEDLCRFDIRTKEDLIFLVRKHWTALIREQDELSELMRKATEGCMPFCNDLSYSRTGLVRVALYLEFGQSWCEYVHRLPFRG